MSDFTKDLLCELGKHFLQSNTCPCDTLEQMKYDLLAHDCHVSPEDGCECDILRAEIQTLETNINRDSITY